MQLLNTIIVDDDKLISEDLSLLIDWEAVGYNLIGSARNGIEAISIMENAMVDLVITDISMPKMDGIELIKHCHKMNQKPKFLVISNYDDFRYVKEALKNGAMDYLLKYEINEDNLTKQLESIKEKIMDEQESKLIKQQLMKYSSMGLESHIKGIYYDMLTKSMPKHVMESRLKEVSISPTRYTYSVVGIQCMNQDNDLILAAAIDDVKKKYGVTSSLSKGQDDDAQPIKDIIMVKIDPTIRVVLMVYTSNSQLYITSTNHSVTRDVLNLLLSNHVDVYSVCVKDVCRSPQDLHPAYLRISAMFDASFYHHDCKILNTKMPITMSTKTDIVFIDEVTNNIISSIKGCDSEGFNHGFEDLFDHFTKLYYRADMVQRCLVSLLDHVQIACDGCSVQLKDIVGNREAYKQKIEGFVRISDLKTWLHGALSNLIDNNKSQVVVNMRPEIRKAITYINANYGKPISLEEVAQRVGLSKNHFCRLFKTEVNDNFVSYVNKIRIKKSVILMKQDNGKLSTLAQEVGFKDYRYFCKVFKAEMGMNPTEYRRKMSI